MAQEITLDFLGDLRRTHRCGELRVSDDGRRVFILAIDSVFQGQDINATQGQPGVMPAIRRMERQALRIRAFLAGASPIYTALED